MMLLLLIFLKKLVLKDGMQWTGVTKDLYEKVREQVNWEGEVPKGAILHIATFDEKGIRVTDVWNSEADLNNFVQNRLMPVTKELIDSEPEIEVYPLHGFIHTGK